MHLPAIDAAINPEISRAMITAIRPDIYEEYLASLLAGDRARCVALVENLQEAGIVVKDLYSNLFHRALYQVGELWEHQQISVAVEHLATAITERLLSLVQPNVFGGANRERSIIIACVADEYHQLGARMVADICELGGWRGFFLGANTPLPDLLRMIEDRKPSMIGLSLSICINLPALEKALDTLGSTYPGLPILVGGQAFRRGALSAVEKYQNVSYIPSLYDLDKTIMTWEK